MKMIIKHKPFSQQQDNNLTAHDSFVKWAGFTDVEKQHIIKEN